MNSNAETCHNLLSGNIFTPLYVSPFFMINSSSTCNTETWSPPLSQTTTNPTHPTSLFTLPFVVRSSSFVSCKGLGTFGGALAVFRCDSVEVENSTFERCSVDDAAETGRKNAGGAILLTGQGDPQVRITKCTFSENRAERGGALVFVNVTRIQIEDSSFTKNEESEHDGRRRQDGRKEERGEGGGVWVCGRVDELLVCGLRCEENKAEGGGWLSMSSLARTSTISSCLLCKNRAERAGGAMLFGGEGDCVSIVFEFCRFEGNTVTAQIGGHEVGSDVCFMDSSIDIMDSLLRVENCSSTSNTAKIGVLSSEGNFSALSFLSTSAKTNEGTGTTVLVTTSGTDVSGCGSTSDAACATVGGAVTLASNTEMEIQVGAGLFTETTTITLLLDQSLSITGDDEQPPTLTTPDNFITVTKKSSLTLSNLVIHPEGRLMNCSIGVISLSSITIAGNANVFSNHLIYVSLSESTDSLHVDHLTVENIYASGYGLDLQIRNCPLTLSHLNLTRFSTRDYTLRISSSYNNVSVSDIALRTITSSSSSSAFIYFSFMWSNVTISNIDVSDFKLWKTLCLVYLGFHSSTVTIDSISLTGAVSPEEFYSIISLGFLRSEATIQNINVACTSVDKLFASEVFSLYVDEGSSCDISHLHLTNCSTFSVWEFQVSWDCSLILSDFRAQNCVSTQYSSLRLEGGTTSIVDSSFSNGSSTYSAGGLDVHLRSGSLHCLRVDFVNCSSTPKGWGQGGMSVEIESGTLTIDSCSFSKCSTAGDGGALFIYLFHAYEPWDYLLKSIRFGRGEDANRCGKWGFGNDVFVYAENLESIITPERWEGSFSSSTRTDLMGYDQRLEKTMSLLPFLRGNKVFVGKDGDDDNDGLDDAPLRTLFAAFKMMKDDGVSFGTILVSDVAVIGKTIQLETDKKYDVVNEEDKKGQVSCSIDDGEWKTGTGRVVEAMVRLEIVSLSFSELEFSGFASPVGINSVFSVEVQSTLTLTACSIASSHEITHTLAKVSHDGTLLVDGLEVSQVRFGGKGSVFVVGSKGRVEMEDGEVSSTSLEGGAVVWGSSESGMEVTETKFVGCTGRQFGSLIRVSVFGCRVSVVKCVFADCRTVVGMEEMRGGEERVGGGCVVIKLGARSKMTRHSPASSADLSSTHFSNCILTSPDSHSSSMVGGAAFLIESMEKNGRIDFTETEVRNCTCGEGLKREGTDGGVIVWRTSRPHTDRRRMRVVGCGVGQVELGSTESVSASEL
ncbi:hypothetical protein BLNAU_19508 [Blattamonas nauphoetae]|uniref:Right handed beta helix domain-containing protein n=1 Tax=Blattamonas nauphoetae TaxID=2049346 RepID=A0ABQ9X4I1_9EUKA|nr:hypothetical protein BLNAU_19508 [Blattamonas nauphoetae]